MNEYILGLFKFLLLLFAFGFTGYLLLFAFSKNKILNSYFKLFMSVFVGLSTAVSFLAVYKTNGMTVNLILLFVMAYLIFKIRTKYYETDISQNNLIIHRFLILVFVSFVLYSYCYIVFGNNFYNKDYLYYTKISYYIFKTGFENDYQIFNLIDKDYHAVTPYHFFDLWLNALNYFIWPLQNNLDTFLKITSSILLSVIFLGFIAIYESYKKVTFFGILFSFSIIFFGGFSIPFFINVEFIKTYEYCFTPYSIFNFAKFSPTVLYFLVLILCFKKLDILTGLLLFSSAAIISVVNLPGVLLSLFLLLLIALFSKRLQQIVSIKNILISFLPVILIILFYLFFGNKAVSRSGTTTGTIIELFTSLFSINVFLQKFKIIGGASIVILLVYGLMFPFYKIILKSYKENINNNELLYFYLTLVALLGGLLAWSLLSPKMNAIQPFYFTLKILPCAVFLLICMSNNGKFVKIITVCILVFSMWNVSQVLIKSFNDNSRDVYIQQYKSINTIFKVSGIVGILKDSTDFGDITSYYPTCYTLGMPLATNLNDFFGISLSDCTLPVVSDSVLNGVYQDGIRMGAFYRFVENQKLNHSFQTIEHSQLDFIKKYNIKYIVATNRVNIPEMISSITDTVISIPLENEKIIKLNY